MAPVDAPPERVSEAFERLWVCYGTSAFHHHRVFALYRDVIACEKANGMTDSTRRRDSREQTRCIS